MSSDSSSTESAPHPCRKRDFFATTHWTAVLAAGSAPTPQARRALEELCQTYWYPLYAYVRRRGFGREDSEDLTQAFFARFLEKNYLEGLSSERGRFRAFLLSALKHFLANEWDRARAVKRGGGARLLSLDLAGAEAVFQTEPADAAAPDKLYDRAWAVRLLDRVIQRLREENAERLAWFEQMKPFLAAGRNEISGAEAAKALGMSEGAVRVAAHRLRRRYRELLREEISQTVSEPSQLEEEMRALFSAFA